MYARSQCKACNIAVQKKGEKIYFYFSILNFLIIAWFHFHQVMHGNLSFYLKCSI